jgi:isoleucyl-tRNA synthetase
MTGFDAPYVPGWTAMNCRSDQGRQATRQKKLQMDPAEVLECRKYAQRFRDLRREQFKRIGVFGRWNNPTRL